MADLSKGAREDRKEKEHIVWRYRQKIVQSLAEDQGEVGGRNRREKKGYGGQEREGEEAEGKRIDRQELEQRVRGSRGTEGIQKRTGKHVNLSLLNFYLLGRQQCEKILIGKSACSPISL